MSFFAEYFLYINNTQGIGYKQRFIRQYFFVLFSHIASFIWLRFDHFQIHFVFISADVSHFFRITSFIRVHKLLLRFDARLFIFM